MSCTISRSPSDSVASSYRVGLHLDTQYKMASKVTVMMMVVIAVFSTLAVMEVEADVLVGSCVWGAVNYKSNCNGECKRMGYKGGHCGSAFNVNCWCET